MAYLGQSRLFCPRCDRSSFPPDNPQAGDHIKCYTCGAMIVIDKIEMVADIFGHVI
jgi:hypothetical protein